MAKQKKIPDNPPQGFQPNVEDKAPPPAGTWKSDAQLAKEREAAAAKTSKPAKREEADK